MKSRTLQTQIQSLCYFLLEETFRKMPSTKNGHPYSQRYPPYLCLLPATAYIAHGMWIGLFSQCPGPLFKLMTPSPAIPIDPKG